MLEEREGKGILTILVDNFNYHDSHTYSSSTSLSYTQEAVSI